mmetsp:Transcript_15599/g.37800  ORF Transcript_15599/g.37800 Transcript_15599/m.37800 type:complete len:1119 (+) Transcript_15599:1703-5059(+)
MFSYLSKKIAIPNGVKLKCVSWNSEQGWIACGGENGLLKVLKLDSSTSKGGQQNSNLSMNQTLEGHNGAVMVVNWNENYRKLTTSDQYGLIIVWMLHKGMWFEEMINNRNKSVVRDMKWTADGQKICIAYEDGAVIVGSVDGKRLWGKELTLQLALVEWSPDGRLILFCTVQGECHIYDGNGNSLSEVHLFANKGMGQSPLIGIDWHDGAEGSGNHNHPALAIGFENGNVQLMRSETDEQPVFLQTGMRASQIQWNRSGTVLSVAGLQSGGDSRDVSMVQFYSPFGQHLRTLRVPGTSINALSWEGSGLRIALAVDSYIYFANIRPDYKWGYFGNTLVYAFNKPDKAEACVIFWDTVTNERYAKYVKRLIAIRACGEYCILATSGEESGQFILILCNAIGSPVDSKYIEVEPLYITMTPYHVTAASESYVYVWQYRTLVSKLTSVDTSALNVNRKEGRERVFHIDNRSTSGELSVDDNKLRVPSAATNDPICAVAASNKLLLVGQESGAVNRYSLPHLALEGQYILRCRPQVMALNCTSSMFSVIDVNGVLTFFDLLPTPSVAPRGTSVMGSHLSFERKDTWDMRWSDDDSELFAMMEKTRMYIFRGTEPEEPVLSSGYICEFHDLQIKAVLLDEVMKGPEKPNKEQIINFETKSLRDTRNLLQDVSIQDAYQFIKDNSHPRLWRLLAEHSLEKLDLLVADKAFVRCADYHGIQFVKRLRMLDGEIKQRAEVSAYFKRFDEAESLYAEVDRVDLAVEMRMHLGDWFKVEKLIQSGAGDDSTFTLAWNNIGNYFADRQKWVKAVAYHAQAQNTEKLVECFYALEDYQGLEKLINMLPEGSQLLCNIGVKFVSVGLCEPAVTAYLRAGDVKAAVDACILLNQWDQAVALAEKHNFQQIEGLLGKYAGHLLEKEKKIAAIDLYRKANKHTEVASLLAQLAKTSAAAKACPLRVKKLYVLAALEVSKFRQIALVADMSVQTHGITANKGTVVVQTLDGLMTLDQVASENSAIEGSWRGAEAYHFWLLAHRQLYDGQFEYARRTSLILLEYEDLLEPVDIYSFIAISSYYSKHYGRCSKAFMKLESIPELSREKLDSFSDLATSIFVKAFPFRFVFHHMMLHL